MQRLTEENIRSEQPAKRELCRILHSTFFQKKKYIYITEVEQTDVRVDSSGEAELKQTVDNLNKRLNMITTMFMCAIVMRIEFAQDALRNRKLRMELEGDDKEQMEGILNCFE